MLGLCRAIQDLAQRARTSSSSRRKCRAGRSRSPTPASSARVFGLPIISQPQVAILGVGSVDKRVVVVDDMIAVRPMCYLTLGYDHRLIDGADAGRFLQALKDRLQGFDDHGCEYDASGTPRLAPDRRSTTRRVDYAEASRCRTAGRGAARRRHRRHAAPARAPAGHHARRQEPRRAPPTSSRHADAAGARGRRRVRDGTRRRRDVPRPRPAHRLSDSRSASPIAATCTATSATSRRC